MAKKMRNGLTQKQRKTGPFTDPLCQKVAGPFASNDEAIENRVRIESYTTPVTFWVDSPESAERRNETYGGAS